MVMESMKQRGWLEHCAPALVFERESVTNGEFIPDAAPTYKYQVLDGNHRITAATRICGGEELVTCRVYEPFPPSLMRILADRECMTG